MSDMDIVNDVYADVIDGEKTLIITTGSLHACSLFESKLSLSSSIQLRYIHEHATYNSDIIRGNVPAHVKHPHVESEAFRPNLIQWEEDLTQDMVLQFSDAGRRIKPIIQNCISVYDYPIWCVIPSPEMGLGDKGQFILGKLLALASANQFNRPLVLNTRSTLLFYGIRTIVKQGILDPERVGIYHFQRREDNDILEVVTVNLDEHGRMDWKPNGFFDTFGYALDELM